MADGMKWIKIVTDIFDDEKIQLIEALPSADSILVIWFKLLVFAGKQNNDGVFRLNQRIAYNDEMLSILFRRKLSTVHEAMKTFEDFGMVERINGAYAISNWRKYQSESEKFDIAREKNRLRQKKWREKQKNTLLQASCNKNNVTETLCHANVTLTDPDPDQDLDLDKNPNHRDVSTVPVDKSVDNFSVDHGRAGSLSDPRVGQELLAFSGDSNLQAALKQWAEMRDGKGKPLNLTTVRRNLSELRKLSSDPKAQRAIIEQSIEKKWIGFYTLDKKNDGKPKKDCPFCHGSGVYQADDGKYYICNCKDG